VYTGKVFENKICRGSSVVERMPGTSGLSRVIGIEHQVNSGKLLRTHFKTIPSQAEHMIYYVLGRCRDYPFTGVLVALGDWEAPDPLESAGVMI